MKTLFLKLSFIAFIGLTIWACTKETNIPNPTNNSQIQPSIMKQDLGYEMTNSDKHFVLLSNEQLLEVQINKLDQLLTNNLPAVEATLIQNLKIELEYYSNNEPNEIISIASQLAEIIPEEDFILMFMALEDYTYHGNYSGSTEVSPDVISEIAALNFRGGFEIIQEPLEVICDCDWTCGSPSSTCATQSSGCGFLWMYPCTQTNWITPE